MPVKDTANEWARGEIIVKEARGLQQKKTELKVIRSITQS